jgi:hypothetical protein
VLIAMVIRLIFITRTHTNTQIPEGLCSMALFQIKFPSYFLGCMHKAQVIVLSNNWVFEGTKSTFANGW